MYIEIEVINLNIYLFIIHIIILLTISECKKNDKIRKNVINQGYDYANLYNLRNTLNKNDKNPIEQNPYKDYMKSSNL